MSSVSTVMTVAGGVILLGLLLASTPAHAAGESAALLHPTQLRTEYLVNPLGLDVAQPRFSWRVESEAHTQHQTGYHVLVASTLDALMPDAADFWDSGPVNGGQTVNVVYEGEALSSHQQCYWSVRVYDRDGKPSPWAPPARFTMGLLNAEDWQADWISFEDPRVFEASPENIVLPPARYFRKDFAADKQVRSAMLHATALGNIDLHLNGERVTEARFIPGWTDYDQRAYYHTFDVTQQVRQGENTLGAMLTDGWYAGYLGYGLLVGYGPNKSGRNFYGKTPALLMQLRVEFQDGTVETIVTDTSWKWATGAVHEADHLMGERVDARDEPRGWDAPGFDDSAWQAAIPAEENGELLATYHDAAGNKEVDLGFKAPPVLEAFPMEHVLPTQVLPPKSIEKREDESYIIDFGQNFAGVVRLRAQGPAGTEITLRYGEMLHPDGRLMTENLRRARATDTYLLRGDTEGETFEPRFTFHGFQYAEVSGYPGELTPQDIEGIVLGTDTRLTSTWESSDPVLNQFFSNVVWTQRANFLEVPTDCPQRDERFGWTGDAQVYARAATYNADVAAFFTKWLQDLRDAQTPEGAYPDYAPYPMQHGGGGKPYATAWGDAGVIVPWAMYQAYGDTQALREHYPSMQKFIEFRQTFSPDFMGRRLGNGWGDWLSMGEKTPVPYIDHCYYAYTAHLVAEMAAVLGEDEDAAKYRELRDNVKATFVKTFVNDDGTLNVDTQTAYVLALDMDMLPEDKIAPAAARLVAKILENDRRMTTGFLGTRPILPVLTESGHFELAVELMQSRRFPSWGYAVMQGATSIWERWNSYTIEDGFQEGMNSFNHYAFGAVVEWLFGTLAGIQPAEPGYNRIRIQPHVPMKAPVQEGVPMLDHVAATYDSVHGVIASAWKREGEALTLNVTIPANTTAEVIMPARAIAVITVDGEPVQASEVVSIIERTDSAVHLEVPSGSYQFLSTLETPAAGE
jgi:alpha-L-rhamnosidase